MMDPNDAACSRVLPYTANGVHIDLIHPLQTPSPQATPHRAVWNWGAALCSTWWAFRHRCWAWALPCLLNLLLWTIIALALPSSARDAQGDPDTADGMAAAAALLLVLGSGGFWLCKTIYLGLYGNRLAIQYGRYTNEQAMQTSLRKWNIRGGLLGGFFLFLLLCEIIWSMWQ